MPETIANGAAAIIGAVADATTSGNNSVDLIGQWLQYGIIGVLILMFITRKFIVPEWVLKQAEERHAAEVAAKDKRIAELEARLQAGTDIYIDKVVPALVASVDVNREILDRERSSEQPVRPTGRSRSADRG